jgi:hypothetical protein
LYFTNNALPEYILVCILSICVFFFPQDESKHVHCLGFLDPWFCELFAIPLRTNKQWYIGTLGLIKVTYMYAFPGIQVALINHLTYRTLHFSAHKTTTRLSEHSTGALYFSRIFLFQKHTSLYVWIRGENIILKTDIFWLWLRLQQSNWYGSLRLRLRKVRTDHKKKEFYVVKSNNAWVNVHC